MSRYPILIDQTASGAWRGDAVLPDGTRRLKISRRYEDVAGWAAQVERQMEEADGLHPLPEGQEVLASGNQTPVREEGQQD